MNNRRLFREQPDEVKQRISQGMKTFHQNNSTEQARKTAAKRSESMKRYWSTIPSRNEYQSSQSHLSMQDYLRGGNQV